MNVIKLLDKDGSTFIGYLTDVIECMIIEERNGKFELNMIFPNGYPFHEELLEGRIIQCKANDSLLNQKFRIYETVKNIDDEIEVNAMHISFDLIYDAIENMNIINQPCDYVLNEIFRNSNFSKGYRGFSDIVNAQNYNMEFANCSEAIVGKEGSVIDTFGTNPEILRDNTDIHVLNQRGRDNGVSVEYRKNLTGFELETNDENLITKILPYASYKKPASEKDNISNLELFENKINYNTESNGNLFIGGLINGQVVEKGSTVPIRVYDIPHDFKVRQLNPLSGQFGVAFDTEIKIVSSTDDYKIHGVWIDQNSPTKWKSLYIDEDAGPSTTYLDFTWNDRHFILGTFKMSIKSDGTKYISAGNIWDYPKLSPILQPTDTEDETITIKGDIIDSPLINNYGHPYFKMINYSSRFKEDNIPTKEELNALARKEFTVNKADLPRQNYKISFIPLSKTTEYKDLQDKISLCDTVDIINSQYNITTKAKVIKVIFNVLTDMYESMELGQPRTTLSGEIPSEQEPIPGPMGPQGPAGADGSIGDFPDSLPVVPQLTLTQLGLSSIQCDWTYENKVYYTYELYASKIKDFNPVAFDLIHEGQASSFLFAAKPGETWYFRVRAKNTHDRWTEFSSQAYITLAKAEEMKNYFTEAAIGNAVVGSLSADYMTAGVIKGQWIDARNLSVTDGSGKRTFDIDSFGNVVLQPTEMKVLTDNKVEFLSTNGYKNMLLYGGQVCSYNNIDNSFIGTVGSIINQANTVKGNGFILSKHCTNFLIGQDSNWDDILTNRSPSPTQIIDIDLINKRMDVLYQMRTGDINLRGNNLFDATTAYVKDLYTFGIRDFSTGNYLLTSSNNRLVVGADVSFNGKQLMNPTLYTDDLYLTNGRKAFGKDPSGANVMFNGVTWDWQGFDLVNAIIRGSTIIPNAMFFNYNLDNTSPGVTVGADKQSIENMLLNEDFTEYDEETNSVKLDVIKANKYYYEENLKLKKENYDIKYKDSQLLKEIAKKDKELQDNKKNMAMLALEIARIGANK